MIPIILIARDKSKIDAFIADYVSSQHIPNYNVYIYQPEKKEFGINEVRAIRQLVVTQPSSQRVIVLQSFDTASLEAQNALLKTLEEKVANNQFILTGENVENVLPTILSRSQVKHLAGKNTEDHEDKYLALFESLIKEQQFLFLAHPLLQGINRDTAREIFDAAIIFLRKRIKLAPYASIVIKKALQTKRLLESNNLNPQLAVDNFLVFWKKEVLR